MQFTTIIRILGILLMLFSFTLLPPILVGAFFEDSSPTPFSYAFFVTFVTGLLLWFPLSSAKNELRTRDGFLVVVLFWTVLGLFGALPFYLSDALSLTATDAIFESMSGLTTTGATVLTGIDDMPKAILFYRQQLQWLGGMGIIVLALAILPMLGVGGMQLYRAEIPGPMKEDKIAPRITETAKMLWYIYLGLTIACALAYWAADMTLFDAISHAFTTVSIGGFSTHDLSLGYYESPLIEMVAVFFMVLAGINFALHFAALQRKSTRPYTRDSELKTYLFILTMVTLMTVLGLIFTGVFNDTWSAVHHGIFQAVSIGTTTGFTTSGFAAWPIFLPILLIFLSFVGGCAGSTGGGMKVVRILLLFKQGMREVKRLVHPSAYFPIKLDNKPVPDRVIEAVWGFFATYVVIFVVLMLLMMSFGLDQVTAFSAVAACLNNLGPGLGEVSQHYGNLSDASKWALCVAMLLGRLEIFTVFVLFTPYFWKR